MDLQTLSQGFWVADFLWVGKDISGNHLCGNPGGSSLSIYRKPIIEWTSPSSHTLDFGKAHLIVSRS